MQKDVTSRGIVIDNDEVILMYRVKNGNEYYAIPGGHIESNETLEECLIREIREEYNINIDIISFLGKIERDNNIEYIYNCKWIDGILSLGGEEKEYNNKDNYYEIKRIKIKDIDSINLYQDNRDMIRKAVKERRDINE